MRKKTSAVDRKSCNCWPIISVQLLAADSGIRPAYTDTSGGRQRAPSTPRWGPPSLHRSFRRATASTVHVASVGFSGVRLVDTDTSGERQRAPSTPRWGPSSLHKSFRLAIASSVHTLLAHCATVPVLHDATHF